MQVLNYLFFDGRAEEAATFYRSALGAEIQMLMRFKENPESMGTPPEAGEKVMHMALMIGETMLMGSDGYNKGNPKFEGFSLSLSAPNDAEAERLFEVLSEGGEVRAPLTKTFFSSRFGMLADKFGVPWMIVVDDPVKA